MEKQPETELERQVREITEGIERLRAQTEHDPVREQFEARERPLRERAETIRERHRGAWEGLPTGPVAWGEPAARAPLARRDLEPCSLTNARDLLARTSARAPGGLIAGPNTAVGYTLTGALRILERADEIALGTWHGARTIQVRTPQGEHVWILRDRPADLDPWSTS